MIVRALGWAKSSSRSNSATPALEALVTTGCAVGLQAQAGGGDSRAGQLGRSDDVTPLHEDQADGSGDDAPGGNYRHGREHPDLAADT